MGLLRGGSSPDAAARILRCWVAMLQGHLARRCCKEPPTWSAPTLRLMARFAASSGWECC
jgi:hypothetical protein